jgi:N-acetylneuraminic acid mutarotase
MIRWAVIALLFCGCNDGLTPGGDLGVADNDFGIGGGGDGGGAAQWEPKRPLPAPRQETAVAALDGKIYVIGGFDRQQTVVTTVEIYDPANDTWTTGPALPKAVHHANAAVANGKLYMLGALQTGLFTAIADTYRLDGNVWTQVADMPSARGSSFVATIGNRIYVAGGWRNNGAVNDHAAYDAVMDMWFPQPVLPAARDHGVGAAVGDKFYAIGGRSIVITSHTSRVDVFNPITGAWASATNMPTSRGGAAAGVVKGRIIVAGGEGNTGSPKGVFAQVESYDPVTNLWTGLTPMLTPRHGTGGAAVGNTFYVPGGADTQAFGAVATVEAITP